MELISRGRGLRPKGVAHTKLQIIILKSDITQADIARELCVSPAFVSNFVHGKCRMPAYRARKFCELLGLNYKKFTKNELVVMRKGKINVPS